MFWSMSLNHHGTSSQTAIFMQNEELAEICPKRKKNFPRSQESKYTVSHQGETLV